MKNAIKNLKIVKQIQKTPFYSRIRLRLPGSSNYYIVDDREIINSGEVIKIDWPEALKKPRVGIIKDLEPYPRWTKYRRFLENNAFEYEIFDLHVHDWMEKARKFDLIIGVISCEPCLLNEMRRKFHVLEKYMGIACYPSADQIFLYEDKSLEAYLSKANDLPFINTHISHDRQDALQMIETMQYPVVSKLVSSSGSVGVQLIKNKNQAKKVVEQAFSVDGRSTHLIYQREKNEVYFQDYMPNDGYDIRAIVVDNWVFGYYRKVLDGDFRASGMNLVEKRDLPEEVIRTAWQANQVIKSPLLIVDMLHGLDGKYYIIEFSITCQMELPEQLHVKGEPGVYIVDGEGQIQFQPGRYWVHELALREYLVKNYIPAKLRSISMELPCSQTNLMSLRD